MRIHGVDKIAPQPLASHDAVNGKILTTLQIRTRAAKRALAVRGMMEAVTWSFIPAEHAELFGGGKPELKLANPIAADMSDMRPSLLPGLLAAAQRNADKGIGDVALFEVSGTYEGDAPEQQRRVAAGVRRGTARLEGSGRHWAGNARTGRRLRRQGRRASPRSKPAARRSTSCRSRRAARPGIIPAAPARSSSARRPCSAISASSTRRRWKRSTSSGPLCGFEVFIDAVPEPKAKPTRTKPRLDLSAFQAVRRDFAFVVDKTVEAGSADQGGARRRPQADHRRQRLRRLRRRVARRGQEVDRHRGVDPADRKDADRRGFRGARRQDRRQRQEADRRRAAGLTAGRRSPSGSSAPSRRRRSAARRSGRASPARRSRRPPPD